MRLILSIPRILLALAAASCVPGRTVREDDGPPALPRMAIPAPPVRPYDPWRNIRLCVVDEQGVRHIPARYNTDTRDTVVEGRPFAEAYPTTAKYAKNAEWFINSEFLEPGRWPYGWYGLPRVMQPHELVPAGEYRGVLMFREVGDLGDPTQVLYAAVEPACIFMVYTVDPRYGAVRG